MGFSDPGECGNGGSLLDYCTEAELRELATRSWRLEQYRRPSGSAPTEHEHCEICWWAIGESDDPDDGSGSTDGYRWLCRRCAEALRAWACS